MAAPPCVNRETIQSANVSTAPTIGSTGMSTAPTRTLPGTRKGRSRSGSRMRNRTTASWPAVMAMSTPKLKRPARKRAPSPTPSATRISSGAITAAASVAAGVGEAPFSGRAKTWGSMS